MIYNILITGLVDRYFFDIVNSFSDNNKNTVKIFENINYKHLDKYGAYIDYINNIEIINSIPLSSKDEILVSDNIDFIRKHEKSYNDYIHIKYDYYSNLDSDSLKPYPMHPNVYKNKQHLIDYHSTEKNMDVCFVGNASTDHYRSPIFNNFFKIQNRHQVFTYLSTNLNKLKDNELVLNNTSYNGNGLVLIDTNVASIDDKEWLGYLSKFKYFIALAGVAMPLCHNFIEAMFCGTIPIIHKNQNTEYGLINEVNCLTYSNLFELEDIIYNILDGEYDSIYDSMRNEVVKYHKELNIKNNELFVNAEQTTMKELNIKYD